MAPPPRSRRRCLSRSVRSYPPRRPGIHGPPGDCCRLWARSCAAIRSYNARRLSRACRLPASAHSGPPRPAARRPSVWLGALLRRTVRRPGTGGGVRGTAGRNPVRSAWAGWRDAGGDCRRGDGLPADGLCARTCRSRVWCHGVGCGAATRRDLSAVNHLRANDAVRARVNTICVAALFAGGTVGSLAGSVAWNSFGWWGDMRPWQRARTFRAGRAPLDIPTSDYRSEQWSCPCVARRRRMHMNGGSIDDTL